MIKKFKSEYIDEEEIEAWLESSDNKEPMFNNFPICEEHKVLLTCFGCHVCND
ncbi:hypothetical protein NNC19_09540 [Clostridium sp. SHJSY1]|uniref:hypothetical protein n=1 Tax=Clostridium sp. SHJSY1 TaxID=2942483 RepID=UPI0028744ABE|nr:hypothetical protein [Clostridium sp. SHJSY1]MDS0525919.1 hypothetical protein [Clostridium sp. SHJSY1]